MIALLMLAEAVTIPMPEFLSGCWQQQRDNGGWTEECWTDSRGGLMIGSGRDGNAEQVRHWEWMRIEKGADGGITFYGSPKGASPVAFTAIAGDSQSITFVNVTHDYPQRIYYQRSDLGLNAEVSLADGDRPNRWSYRPAARADQK